MTHKWSWQVVLVLAAIMVASLGSADQPTEPTQSVMARLERLELDFKLQREADWKTWEEQLATLRAENEEQRTKFGMAWTEIDNLKSQMAAILPASGAARQVGDERAAAAMPTSCIDLMLMGHTLNGFYLVKGSSGTKIEATYCDFKTFVDAPIEMRFGTVDVKASPVYFYMQRRSSFSSITNMGKPITFEVERLNIGGAMNAATGIFTAPRAGVYHFTFTGVQIGSNPDANGALSIFLSVNSQWPYVGYAYCWPFSNFTTVPAILTATLKLKAKDTVSMIMNSGILYDDANQSTHFSGYLLEEDLVIP